MNHKEWYRRNLPHIQPLDGVFNICFQLNGSLPAKVIKTLKQERDHRMALLEELRQELPPEVFLREQIKYRDRYFNKFNELLDRPSSRPTFLREDRIAGIVKNAIHFWDGQKLRVICYCIMPNHVHLMIDSCTEPLYVLLKSIKNYSARHANKALSRTGNRFWQRESYDNLVVDEYALAVKINYILNNPVKAKLANNWSDWKHSYVHPEFEQYVAK